MQGPLLSAPPRSWRFEGGSLEPLEDHKDRHWHVPTPCLTTMASCNGFAGPGCLPQVLHASRPAPEEGVSSPRPLLSPTPASFPELSLPRCLAFCLPCPSPTALPPAWPPVVPSLLVLPRGLCTCCPLYLECPFPGTLHDWLLHPQASAQTSPPP